MWFQEMGIQARSLEEKRVEERAVLVSLVSELRRVKWKPSTWCLPLLPMNGRRSAPDVYMQPIRDGETLASHHGRCNGSGEWGA